MLVRMRIRGEGSRGQQPAWREAAGRRRVGVPLHRLGDAASPPAAAAALCWTPPVYLFQTHQGWFIPQDNPAEDMLVLARMRQPR